MFVTSQPSTADLDGLNGADIRCQTLADESPLARGGRYKAWLSTSDASPATRFTNIDQTGPYQLVTGETIAADWATLTDGSIDRRINIDEFGEAIPVDGDNPLVWTKTTTAGVFWSSDTTCGDWTVADASLTAGGDARVSNAFWTQGFLDLPCSSQFRLYCFEQG